jgi:hypothetical protein
MPELLPKALTPAKACPLLIPYAAKSAMLIRNCFRAKCNSGTFRIVGASTSDHEAQHKHQSEVDNECDSNHIHGNLNDQLSFQAKHNHNSELKCNM